jgi:hypothetical protein
MRTHQRRMEVVRKNPAISHHPPCSMGGKRSPISGGGGSSASQGSWRTNSTGSHPTLAHMFRPMISKATKPKISDISPAVPRYTGPTCASPMIPRRWLKRPPPLRVHVPGATGTPGSGAMRTCTRVKRFW